MMVEDAILKILAAALRDEKETLEMRRNFSMMLAREMMDPLRELNKAARLFEEDTPEAAKARSAVKYMNNVVKNIQQYEMLERGHVKSFLWMKYFGVHSRPGTAACLVLR